MKKTLILLCVISALLSLAGCGAGAASGEAAVPAESSAPAKTERPVEAAASADPALSAAPADTPKPDAAAPDAVDVDLTLLSSTMIYSEVYAMVSEPERYAGKTVKMNGSFATQEYDGQRLFACIVQDATACCAQGLEFELADDRVYPDDYPDPGAKITVIGTFDSYREEVDGNYYVYLVLRNARLL